MADVMNAAVIKMLHSWLGDDAFRLGLSRLYEVFATRWRSMGDRHPGTARLWADLAARARITASRIAT